MNIYYNPNRAGAAGKAGKAWWGCRFSFKQAEATLLKAKLNWLYRWNKVWLLHMGALFYFYFIFYLCSCPWYGRKTLKYHKNFLKITLQTPVCFALLTVSHRHPPPPRPPPRHLKILNHCSKELRYWSVLTLRTDMSILSRPVQLQPYIQTFGFLIGSTSQYFLYNILWTFLCNTIPKSIHYSP